MDQTINRGYPYPECEPPLTKDASDIAHLFNLAQAVADDVQAIVDRSDDVLIRPDGCRRSISGTITEQQFFPVFTGPATFDTTGGAMSSGTHGGILLVEPGWYLVGGVVQAVSTTALGIRITFTVDGAQRSSFGPQGQITGTNTQNTSHGVHVFSENPNAVLGLHIRNGAASPSFAYSAALFAQQVAKV